MQAHNLLLGRRASDGICYQANAGTSFFCHRDYASVPSKLASDPVTQHECVHKRFTRPRARARGKAPSINTTNVHLMSATMRM